MDRKTNGYTYGWTERQMDIHMDGQKDKWIYIWMDRKTNGYTYGWIERQMDIHMDG